jgi:hypothetical protein
LRVALLAEAAAAGPEAATSRCTLTCRSIEDKEQSMAFVVRVNETTVYSKHAGLGD